MRSIRPTHAIPGGNRVAVGDRHRHHQTKPSEWTAPGAKYARCLADAQRNRLAEGRPERRDGLRRRRQGRDLAAIASKPASRRRRLRRASPKRHACRSRRRAHLGCTIKLLAICRGAHTMKTAKGWTASTRDGAVGPSVAHSRSFHTRIVVEASSRRLCFGRAPAVRRRVGRLMGDV